MAGKRVPPHRRLPPDGHGRPARATVNLVVPLAHEATAMRITDTAATPSSTSGAVSALAQVTSGRGGDVDSTNDRLTPATSPTPGSRASTTATRTTITRTTTTAHAPSADQPDAGFSFTSLVQAYYDCRRTKRTSHSALAFEQDLERGLWSLYEDLAGCTWQPGPTICFIITRPKPREVWAADFRDRIVHHLLYNHIGAAIERTFIADSCACIPGRGTHYAARRLEAKVRSQTQNWARPGWYLKCDLANFFVSIDKRILDRQIAGRILSPWWSALARTILWHDPRQDVQLRSTAAELARIPPHKSLFNQPAHLGLPIGNLSSQFFANVFLDALDQHVKHRLRARHYIRYVDDFILLHESPQQLNAWRADIAAFLPRELGVRLNDSKTILQPIDRGIDFAGQVIKPWHRRIRRRTFHDALTRIADHPAGDVFRSANSYFGLFRQATHSHADRTRLANLVRRRGLAVNHPLTKAYR